MRRFFADMNPTVRGFLIIGAIVIAIVVLNLYTALATVSMLMGVAFFLAIAFFIYLVWRERRDEIGTWSGRERFAFYGGALLIVGALGVYFWRGLPGYEQLGFIGVVAGGGYAMFRIWRDRHSFGR